MKVNLAATKGRLKSSGRKMAPYAVAKDINPETLRKFFNGSLPTSEGPVYSRIINTLREDGLLVADETDD